MGASFTPGYSMRRGRDKAEIILSILREVKCPAARPGLKICNLLELFEHCFKVTDELGTVALCFQPPA
jgi:hypothetical protein